jgi:hypothetical protein
VLLPPDSAVRFFRKLACPAARPAQTHALLSINQLRLAHLASSQARSTPAPGLNPMSINVAPFHNSLLI